MTDDLDLVREYLTGREEAIEELVTRYQKMIFSLTYRMTGDVETARDLTQEAFIRAVQGLKKFRGDSSFKTWLYRIAANICLNAIRRNRSGERDAGTVPMRAEEGALSMVLEKEKDSHLKKAVRMLPARQKLAVTLRALEGLGCKETAQIMKCSEGAVKAHYHNGIKKLKALIRESGYET